MTDTTEEKVGETFQLYVKNTSNCEGLPLQTFELLGPTWSGDKIELPFGEPPDVKRCDVVGWTDLFMGQPCPVNVAGVNWLPSNVPAITGGPAAPTLGLLVWGGNSGVRILDDQAEPTPGIDDHLPRGFGRPIIWIEDPADLPEEVRRVVMTPKVEFGWLVSQLSPEDQKKIAFSIMAMKDVKDGLLPPEVGQEYKRLLKAQDLEGLSAFLAGLGYTESDSPKHGNTYVCDLCGFQADQREAIHDHLKTAHQVTEPGEVGSLQQDGRNLTLKNGDDVTVIPLDTWLGSITIHDATPAMADVISGSVQEPKAPGTHQVWWHWATRTQAGRRALEYIGCTVNPEVPWQKSQDGWQVQPWVDPNEAELVGQFDHAADKLRDVLGDSNAGVFFAEKCVLGGPPSFELLRSNQTMIAVNVDGTRAAVYKLSPPWAANLPESNVGATLPTPGAVFINVWNCRAVVARYESAEGGVTWASAKNAEDLEDEAVEAVEAQGGAVNMSGHYACPLELAAKASFDEEKGD